MVGAKTEQIESGYWTFIIGNWPTTWMLVFLLPLDVLHVNMFAAMLQTDIKHTNKQETK